jgi:hypothetical protein
MGKIVSFILKRKIAISACALVFIFGFAWWILAFTTIGEDVSVGGDFSVGGQIVITSLRALQNVIADIAIMPTGGTWNITSDLTIETPTLFIGSDGGTYAGRVGIGTATPGTALHVVGDIYASSNAHGDCTTMAWDCASYLACPAGTFMVRVDRGVTGTGQVLCGTEPTQWYKMQIECCKI